MYEKLEFSRYSLLFGVTLITILIGFEVNDLYQSQRSMLNIREFRLIFRTWMMAFGVTMVILYMADELYFSRGMFLLTWFILLILLMLERYGFFKFNTLLNTLGIVETTVIIYGTGILGQQLITKFKRSPKLGHQVAGFVDDEPSVREINGLPVLGSFSNLKKIIRETGADKLFIAITHVTSDKVVEILKICRETGCKFQVIPSIYESALERVTMTDVEGIPLIGIQMPRPGFWVMAVKRIFDFTLAAVLIVLLFPVVLLLFPPYVYISWPRVINRDIRVGRNERTFMFYQLAGCGTQGSFPELKYVKQKILIKLMRKCGLCIYPQLWNILKGDMSFVGPRTEVPEKVKKFGEIQKQKLNVRPGITGMWNVSPHGDSMFYQDKDMDIYYIQNMSLFLDVIILVRRIFRLYETRDYLHVGHYFPHPLPWFFPAGIWNQLVP
jgi:lipopolysaccharide/colanic/teichoic acid biosynthesis glycosyltransferase